jgi:hypothetical protein
LKETYGNEFSQEKCPLGEFQCWKKTGCFAKQGINECQWRETGKSKTE